MNKSVKYTPDSETYPGLKSVIIFDHLIVALLNLNSQVAAYTRKQSLSRLQKATTQIVPQGLSIALSVRELVRQGHLFAAAVLMCSLVERVGVISYLVKEPSALDNWESGWRHGERPPLNKMLKTLSNGKDKKGVNRTVDTFNHLVHGDPMGGEFNLAQLDEAVLECGVGRAADKECLCDFICEKCISWLTVLCATTSAAFPEVWESAN